MGSFLTNLVGLLGLAEVNVLAGSGGDSGGEHCSDEVALYIEELFEEVSDDAMDNADVDVGEDADETDGDLVFALRTTVFTTTRSGVRGTEGSNVYSLLLSIFSE